MQLKAPTQSEIQEFGSLTSDELAHFKEHHYCVRARPVFSHDVFQKIKNYFFDFVNQVPEEIRYLNFTNDERYLPAIDGFVNRKELLEIVHPIAGEDLAFWSIGICYKPPFSKYEVGWHIDSHCWMRDQVIDPPEVVNLFFSLTDMSKESGGLRLISGLNTPKFYNHVERDPSLFFFKHEIVENELPMERATDIALKANQLICLASHVPHRSGPNLTAQPRLGISLRYMRTDVKVSHTPLDGRDYYLVSGKDLSGSNRYSDISKRGRVPGL